MGVISIYSFVGALSKKAKPIKEANKASLWSNLEQQGFGYNCKILAIAFAFFLWCVSY
jgi:hypothetical protein